MQDSGSVVTDYGNLAAFMLVGTESRYRIHCTPAQLYSLASQVAW